MKAPCPDGDRWHAQLSALLDGEGPGLDVSAVGAHLAACDACSAWLDHATAVNATIRRLTVVSPRLGDRVVDAVDVHLCGCRRGERCGCGNCQCGPACTCHAQVS